MAKKVKTEQPSQSQQALDELKADLQRVQADFVNFKRRIEGERVELLQLAKADVVAELVPLFDNFDRALDHIPPELNDNAWVQGIAQVDKQIGEVLAQTGVSVYGQVGDEFDPKLHEAIAHEGSGDHITEVFQKGYRIDERVIRPARVKVGEVSESKEK
jgi:molecular chaperone GrpE